MPTYDLTKRSPAALQNHQAQGNHPAADTPTASSGVDRSIFNEIISSVLATLVLAVIVGGLYPLLVWGVGQGLFKHKADGSLIVASDGKAVLGSELLGQNFGGKQYFNPRPSAAGAAGYDPTASGGTNLGPTSDKLVNGQHKKDSTGNAISDPANFDGIKDLVTAYHAANGLKENEPVPADAVTRSASGLDPHISLANARLQLPRVARERGVTEDEVHRLVDRYTAGRDLGVLGEPRVNTLLLNLALDGKSPPAQTGK